MIIILIEIVIELNRLKIMVGKSIAGVAKRPIRVAFGKGTPVLSVAAPFVLLQRTLNQCDEHLIACLTETHFDMAKEIEI